MNAMLKTENLYKPDTTGVQNNGGKNKVFFQPRLTINHPGDVYEQEADAVADNIMRMTAAGANNSFFKSSSQNIQRKCQHCEEEEEKKLQRKEQPGTEGEAPLQMQSYVQSLSGKGRTLTPAEKMFFEPRFGYDFSNVHVHTDSKANQSANDVNALAYTTGNNIVFAQGQYQPGTDSGKKLMAHELTHVVQQAKDSSLKRFVQRQTVTLNTGRVVGNTPLPQANIREDVLDVMDSLHTGWSLNNADYTAERPVVSAVAALSTVPVASIPKTIAAIHTNEQPTLSNLVAAPLFGLTLSGTVGAGMSNAKADIRLLQDYLHTHWFLNNADYTTEHTAVDSGPDPVTDATIPRTLAALSAMKIAKIAQGFSSHNILGGTHALSATERSQVEATLIPGATSSGGTVTIPTPDAICTTPALETEIRANIVPYLHSTATNFNARKTSPPVLPVPQMNSMADIVQNELQTYFGEYLRGATHTGASKYTPGSYTVRSQLHDQSTVTQWQTLAGRKGWVNYWISTRMGNTHNCNSSDIDTVAENIAKDATLTADIDTTVQSWPAEATNGININPYIRDPGAGTAEIRRGRWDAFTTIMHEAIHHLVHPNFVATYTQMRDDSKQILKEGFDDMFRHELWYDAGNLANRIADPAYNTKRAVIEGSALPYDPSVVFYHSEYSQITQATNIRNTIGNNNCKAAYFLGHTELLGLGAGSHGLTSTGTFAGTAMYNTTDANQDDRVTLLAGETFAALTARLNARAGSITNDAGTPVTAATTPLPAAVRVAGIRHVTVIAGDTLNSIAAQNGVTPFDITRANNLSSTVVTTGQRLIIPVH
jgi:hypothetical protein